MKDIIYITGHKNPDTDSICAAIGYAEFKNKTGNTQPIPIRLGEINRETKYILDYFKIKIPTYLETVKTQVSDLNIDKVAPVSPDISLKMAWSIMKKHGIMTLPVVDENDKLLGVVSLSNLTSTYMDVWDSSIFSKSNTKLENIIETLAAKPVFINETQNSLGGKIVVAAMLPENIKKIVDENDIVICGDREDSQEIVIKNKASLLIITGGHKVTDKIIDCAKQYGCSLITTPYDSFTASRLITQSIPISYVMTKDNIISFSLEDFVDDIKDIMLETRYRSYPVLDKDGKVMGSISRYHLISKNQKKIILVDHNEKTQSVHGLEDAEVLEIIDHHRIADIETGLPIYFRNEPVGSTSTIIASIFFENGIRPSKKIAGLLCAAIISDTLFLKSPTSTLVDKIMLKRLSSIAGINPDEFAKNMFKAGTSLDGRTAEEIFYQDFKTFTLNSFKVGVSQVTTMDMEGLSEKKPELISLMEDKADKLNYDILLLMATDIIRSGSELIAVGKHKEIIGKAFKVSLDNNSVYIDGLVSRKKQIIPPITKAINEL